MRAADAGDGQAAAHRQPRSQDTVQPVRSTSQRTIAQLAAPILYAVGSPKKTKMVRCRFAYVSRTTADFEAAGFGTVAAKPFDHEQARPRRSVCSV